jgi:hypothetical protein
MERFTARPQAPTIFLTGACGWAVNTGPCPQAGVSADGTKSLSVGPDHLAKRLRFGYPPSDDESYFNRSQGELFRQQQEIPVRCRRNLPEGAGQSAASLGFTVIDSPCTLLSVRSQTDG